MSQLTALQTVHRTSPWTLAADRFVHCPWSVHTHINTGTWLVSAVLVPAGVPNSARHEACLRTQQISTAIESQANIASRVQMQAAASFMCHVPLDIPLACHCAHSIREIL